MQIHAATFSAGLPEKPSKYHQYGNGDDDDDDWQSRGVLIEIGPIIRCYHRGLHGHVAVRGKVASQHRIRCGLGKPFRRSRNKESSRSIVPTLSLELDRVLTECVVQ